MGISWFLLCSKIGICLTSGTAWAAVIKIAFFLSNRTAVPHSDPQNIWTSEESTIPKKTISISNWLINYAKYLDLPKNLDSFLWFIHVLLCDFNNCESTGIIEAASVNPVCSPRHVVMEEITIPHSWSSFENLKTDGYKWYMSNY